MTLLEFTGVAVVTSLKTGISPTDTTIELKDGNGWPSGAVGPFIATIGDPDANDSLEKILVTGGRAGNVLSGCTRGYEGTAQIWGPNTKIRHTISALWASEVSFHVNDPTRHDHTQYLRAVDHAAIGHTAAMLDPASVGTSELQDNAVTTGKIPDGAVTTPKLPDGAVTLPKLATAVSGLLVPTGSIVAFGGTAAPTGWLFCDGSLVNRVTQAALFAVLGTAYGAGDGVNTFGLPDLRQRFPLGRAGSPGTGDDLGETGGAIDHTHDLNTATSHAKINIEGAPDRVIMRKKAVASWNSTRGLTGTEGAVANAYTEGVELGGLSSAVNPPFQVVNFIVKT